LHRLMFDCVGQVLGMSFYVKLPKKIALKGDKLKKKA